MGKARAISNTRQTRTGSWTYSGTTKREAAGIGCAAHNLNTNQIVGESALAADPL